MTYDNTDADSDGVIEADIDNDSVNTPRVFTESRSENVVVLTDGTTVTAIGADGIIDEGSDGGAVIQSVHDNISSGGRIAVRGHIGVSTPFQITKPDIEFHFSSTGDGFVAEASIGAICQARGLLKHGPRFYGGVLDGNNKADHFIDADSTSRVHVVNSKGLDFNSRYLHGYADASTANFDNWWVVNNFVENAPQFSTIRPGSSAHPTDHYFIANQHGGADATGWAFEFIDTQRAHLWGNIVGNNSTAMDGAVRVVADGSYGGSPFAADGNYVGRTYYENQVTGAGYAVEFDALGSTNLIDNHAEHIVQNTSGNGGEAIFRNSSGTTRKNRGNSVSHFLNPPVDVTVESGVLAASIDDKGTQDKVQAAVTDNGDFTRINGEGTEAAGEENPPTGFQWRVGNTVLNTSDSTLWHKHKNNGFIQIGSV